LGPDTEHVKISDTTGDHTAKGGDGGEYKNLTVRNADRKPRRIERAFVRTVVLWTDEEMARISTSTRVSNPTSPDEHSTSS
jgi:hypothetical protein